MRHLRILPVAVLLASSPIAALADQPAWPHFAHPSYSPHGDRIAIDCGPGGELDLCLYEVAEGRLRRLTATADMQEAVPVFSRDGRRLSFSRERGNHWYLTVLHLDTGRFSELVRLTIPHASSSSWSPDDRRLAFDMLNDDGDHDIYSVAPDGSDLRVLVGGPGSQRFPTFSRDGALLAYAQIVDGAGDIMVARADGSSPRAITDHPADEGVPMWSPDATRLSFYRNLDGNYEVFITDLDGAETQLTDHPAFDIFATFTADGGAVVFESNRDRDPSGFGRGADLYRLELGTLELERLTTPDAFPPADARD